MTNPINNLFWEKYRPKTFEEVVLLDRTKSILQHGIQTNLILAGPPGIGKTTVARILVKKYPHITLSSKLGVDVLRNEVQQFCSKMTINFEDDVVSDMKIVYLEEFDGASRQMQDELRAFMEVDEYKDHVRFIATCNHIQKIEDAILSRFTVVDFTPNSSTESKELKTKFLKYLLQLNTKENFNIDKNILKEIVIKTFPDFRQSLQSLQVVHLTGEFKTDIVNTEDNQIYECIFGKMNNIEVWNYLYKNWLDRFDLAFEKFNRNFWYYVEQHHPESITKLPHYYITISKYIDTHLPNARDPFVTLYAMISELKNI